VATHTSLDQLEGLVVSGSYVREELAKRTEPLDQSVEGFSSRLVS
jgi:hypothetical protein